MLERNPQFNERSADKEEKMSELWQMNAAFESLMHRHGEVTGRMRGLAGQGGEPGSEAEILRRRQAAIEDEMLLIMDQSSRV